MAVTPVPKEDEKTVIPVTEDSASRSGKLLAPHPLCEQVKYLVAKNQDKYLAYCQQLQQWVASPHTHPIPESVLVYVQADSLLRDLGKAGVLMLDGSGAVCPQKIQGKSWEDCLIRWRVIPAQTQESGACWKSKSLFRTYQDYYEDKIATQPLML